MSELVKHKPPLKEPMYGVLVKVTTSRGYYGSGVGTSAPTLGEAIQKAFGNVMEQRRGVGPGSR